MKGKRQGGDNQKKTGWSPQVGGRPRGGKKGIMRSSNAGGGGVGKGEGRGQSRALRRGRGREQSHLLGLAKGPSPRE